MPTRSVLRFQIIQAQPDSFHEVEAIAFRVKKTNSPILAYWLLPAEPFASYLTIWIRTLAERFDAAIFAPHVTLYAGPEIVGDSPERILRETTRKYSGIVLRHEGIRHSDQFTKTVYVKFEETDDIIKLSKQLRQRHSCSSGYEFQPHLSLIYASLKAVQREEVIASCVLPFSEIAFDQVTAIVAPGKTESRADVEAWKSACGAHPLSGSNAPRRLSARKN